jgi:hypothetical protein
MEFDYAHKGLRQSAPSLLVHIDLRMFVISSGVESPNIRWRGVWKLDLILHNRGSYSDDTCRGRLYSFKELRVMQVTESTWLIE